MGKDVTECNCETVLDLHIDIFYFPWYIFNTDVRFNDIEGEE